MIRFSVIFLLAVWLIGSVSSSGALAEVAYDERVFVSGYNEVTVVDPAEPKVVASIPVKGPARDMSFSKNGKVAVFSANGRTTLYVVDTVANKVIDEITLSGRTDKGLLERRIWGAAISPDATKAYAFITQSEKRTNIFKALPCLFVEIDLKTKEITRKMEAPYGIHGMQFSQNDSNRMFVWGYDIYEVDLNKWELKVKHGLKHPADEKKEGIGNYLLLFPRGENGYSSIPIFRTYPDGKVTEGIFWIDMKTEQVKSIEYDREPIGMFSAVIEPGEKYAYSILNKWYKIELPSGKVIKESKPPHGTTYGINISHDGERLYLAGAGNEFHVANKDLEILKTITLPTDGLDLKVIKIEK